VTEKRPTFSAAAKKSPARSTCFPEQKVSTYTLKMQGFRHFMTQSLQKIF